MSHMTKMSLEMKGRKYLVEALKKMGYTTKDGSIKDYYGKEHSKEAIVINELPSVGFKVDKNGKFEMHSDFYNTDVKEKEFTHTLQSQYTLALAKEQLRRKGVRLGRERIVDGVIHVSGTW